jgi:hypothetical protein
LLSWCVREGEKGRSVTDARLRAETALVVGCCGDPGNDPSANANDLKGGGDVG